MKIVSVVGARPNFMKIAPFIRVIESFNQELRADGSERRAQSAEQKTESSGRRAQSSGQSSNIEQIKHILVHTGQHYDTSMSRAFFDDLDIPEADINLGVGSGSHAEQVGNTMIAFEKVLKTHKPDWVVVVGDVNATLACSVTAKKECIKVCHIEAGLRSGDLTMPEEINRLVTDRLSDLLLAPDLLSVNNLKAEGVPGSKIRFVGNIMIDTLEANRVRASQTDIGEIINRNTLNRVRGAGFGMHGKYDLVTGKYAVITIHRPSNVDNNEKFRNILNLLTEEFPDDLPVIWPVHPRARKNMEIFGFFGEVLSNPKMILLEPLGYIEMLRLNMGARIILTDSGGLQEECTVLGTPCLTLRENTERPVTLREHGGASVLVGSDTELIRKEIRESLLKPGRPCRPELWDGHTAERCLRAILEAEVLTKRLSDLGT